jgi:hypothetical protein
MHERKELTEFQKGGIVAFSHDKNDTDIGNDLHIPRQTVVSFLQRFNQHQSSENLHRSGRPRKTSAAADRWLVRTALEKTKLPLKELKSICNIPISTRTIQRRLAKNNIRKWRAVGQAQLTPKHAEDRLKWAILHQNWTIEMWKGIV